MNYIEEKNIPGLLLIVDFEKAFHSSLEIKRLKIGDVVHILSQFADDTTIILDGSEQSLAAAIKTLVSFAKLSNLKVNSSKKRAIWINCKKFSGETFNHRLKLNWNQTNFDILGIKFSCNIDTMVKIKYKDKIEQIEKELKICSKRKLTPFGRITVLKLLLYHLFIALPNLTEEIINNLQKSFFLFIWQSGIHRIKRDILMQEYDRGGLKMIT